MEGRRKFIRSASLEEALAIWNQRIKGLDLPLCGQDIPLEEALGRVTSGPVSALISSPFYRAAAMDGYAVRFHDTLGASETSAVRLTLGPQARYADTGDPLPDGFDAIVMQEAVNSYADGTIEIITPATPWQHVRQVGEDIVATELIIPMNHPIRPVDIGAMLAGGHTSVSVRRRPRVAIIPTGSELVEPGSPLGPGDIIEYNSRLMEAMVRELGAEPIRHPIVRDDRGLLAEAIASALDATDIVVINAGASGGSEDFTCDVIGELGEVLVHGIAIRPGKPSVLGWVRGRPVVGTPGYPVAAYVVFGLFVRPLIERMLGIEPGDGPRAEAVLTRQVASRLGAEEFVRMKLGRVGGRLVATPLGRGAGLLMSLVRADAVMGIPAGSEGLGAGTTVTLNLLRPMRDIERTVVLIGSHDNALDILGNELKRLHPGHRLSSAHVGSMGGLMAIKKGEAHLATSHLLDEATGEYNIPFIERLLPEVPVALINLAYREQGLIIPRGNPKGIEGFEDLRRPDVTYINRQRGAGTRLLLDKHLAGLGIPPREVAGYENEEYTHMAVAQAVASGAADTGLGVLSAARALGLDFIAVARERYDLVIPLEHMGLPGVAALLDVIRSCPAFKEAVEALGGYGTEDMGRELWRG